MSINGGALGESGSVDESLDFRAENIKNEPETEYFVNVKNAEAQKKQAERRVRFAKMRGIIHGWVAGISQRIKMASRKKKCFALLFLILLFTVIGATVLLVVSSGTDGNAEIESSGVGVGDPGPVKALTKKEKNDYETYVAVRGLILDIVGPDRPEGKTYEDCEKQFKDLLEDYSGNPSYYFFLRLEYARFLLDEGNNSEEALIVLGEIDDTQLSSFQLNSYYSTYAYIYQLSGDYDRAVEYSTKIKREEADEG